MGGSCSRRFNTSLSSKELFATFELLLNLWLLKKAFAAFFLLVFSFTIVGVYLLFGLQLFQVKRQMMQQIVAGVEAGKLVSISASEENQFVLFDGGKELRYGNTMYDVVETLVNSDGRTVYHCLPDLEETALLAGFQKLIKAGSEHHQKNTPVIFYKFLVEIIPERQDQNQVRFTLRSSNFAYSNRYSVPELELLSPPPRQI